jgi:hypothetical protein
LANNVEHMLAYRRNRHAKHKDELNRKTKEWRAVNKPKVKAKNDAYRAKHGEDISAKHSEWYQNGGSEIKSATSRVDRARNKRIAIEAYGGKCLICGETIMELLALDHIRDDGAKHRIEAGLHGGGAYRWVRQNNFPSIFQVLCHNHNAKKERLRVGIGTSSAARCWQRAKRAALGAYGGACACCGECDYDMLQLDHIDGGGRKHMCEIRTTHAPSMAVWARRNGFPPVFQTLCANCNMSRQIGGGLCIHRRLLCR